MHTLTRTVLAAVVAIAFVQTAAAQAPPELMAPGAAPGDLTYGLDRAGEALSMALTFSSEAKAKKKLRHAEERLAEARALADRNETARAEDLDRQYGDAVAQSRRYAGSVAEVATRQDIDAVISRATDIHMRVLERQGVNPGEPGYDAKRTAENVTVDTEHDPVEKARKQARAAGHRVNETERLTDAGQPDRAAEAAEDYDQEMQELSRLGQQVSDAAQRRQVEEVVARATQHHQDVLQRVMDRVPAQAQDAIARAMNASSRGHATAVQQLRETGGVPSGVLESIPGSTGRPVGGDTVNRGRSLLEDGRQDLQRGNDLLDQNDTVEAAAAYREAASTLQRAVTTLEGIDSDEAQSVLDDARSALQTAQDAAEQTEQYNRQTGQTDGTNRTRDGSDTQGGVQ